MYIKLKIGFLLQLWHILLRTLACQHAEITPGPLVSIYAVAVYVADKNSVIVVIQIIST